MTSTDSKAEVARRERRRYRLMIEGSVQELATLLSPDLIYIHSSGGVDDKATFLQHLDSGDLEYLSIDHAEDEVVVSEGTAVILGRMEARVRLKGNARTVKNRHIVVWSRNADGEWQMVAYHPQSLIQN